ncbi:MAG: type II toxin-antitoxin system HicA family toxin [Thiomonas sp.]|uniref:type II toxin-antitoxin system HicA family toxin n=1 Tax=Thiomonas sp. TaxID=2047785 RepID=UPI002A3647D5|nr:type II toxin-antitoxin system HicA family toxin [Thiomonas sp.]MDY0331726.1 type II toxin-antitoxin system HicA family toxin [Thiomonas sp.]
MSQWPSSKAKRVYAALLQMGWQLKRQTGSHRTLARGGGVRSSFVASGQPS